MILLLGLDGFSGVGLDGCSGVGLDGCSCNGLDGFSCVGLDGCSGVDLDGCSCNGLEVVSLFSSLFFVCCWGRSDFASGDFFSGEIKLIGLVETKVYWKITKLNRT